jgi:hypothetical protein
MENGLFLSALAITGGMPLIIELGIFFDVLVGVLVMGAIVIKISHSFQSLDINHLRKLRGSGNDLFIVDHPFADSGSLFIAVTDIILGSGELYRRTADRVWRHF